MSVHGVAFCVEEHPLGFALYATARFAALHCLPDGSCVRFLAEAVSTTPPVLEAIVPGGISGWHELNGPAVQIALAGRFLRVPARTWARVALRLWPWGLDGRLHAPVTGISSLG